MTERDVWLAKVRSKPRRGRIRDKAYMEFIGTLPCMVCGANATVHHVRRFGSPKDDRRTLPLCGAHHQIQFGPFSIEAMGKPKFEAYHDVNLEESIVRYNTLYEGVGL